MARKIFGRNKEEVGYHVGENYKGLMSKVIICILHIGRIFRTIK